MTAIRTAFISYTFSFGGIQKSMLMIAQQLRERGFEFHFISCDRNDFQNKFHEYGICRHIPDEHDLLGYLIENKIDLVQLNHSAYGGLVAYLAGVKGIVERVDGLKSAFMFDKMPVDSIISSTQRVLEQSAERYPEKYNIKIVNGVDLQMFAPSGSNPVLREQLGIGQDDIVVGYSGRLSEEKCIDKLVDVFSNISRTHCNVKLAILGTTTRPNEKAHYNFLVDKIAGLQLSDKIFFLPQTEFPQQVMNMFDIGVYIAGTYKRPDGSTDVTVEGYTNALLELSAMGKPLVATNSGDVDGVIQDGRTGFIVGMDDTDAFSVRLLELIDNQQLRTYMGANGREFIEKKFSFSLMAQRYEKLYRFVLSNEFSIEYPYARRAMANHYLGNPFPMTRKTGHPAKILIFRSGSRHIMEGIFDMTGKLFSQPKISILCHRNNFHECADCDYIEKIYRYDASDTFDLELMSDLIQRINDESFDYLFFIYNDFLGRGCGNITPIVNSIRASETVVTTSIRGGIRSFVFPR
ncbi:MAG: glycosyltransferase family 4 protein [Candidatus Auribacterota bacterium]|jgi:glycosyltransferase involved in cell wall biosynthesis|nr:glycosyltransferase family 4 protein [Candidatus Auribacterota bacterium]